MATLNVEAKSAAKYPCGREELGVIVCGECAKAHGCVKIALATNECSSALTDYIEVQAYIAAGQREHDDKLFNRRKCQRLARQILRQREKTASLTKELTTLFYSDNYHTLPFTQRERMDAPITAKIRLALDLNRGRFLRGDTD